MKLAYTSSLPPTLQSRNGTTVNPEEWFMADPEAQRRFAVLMGYQFPNPEGRGYRRMGDMERMFFMSRGFLGSVFRLAARLSSKPVVGSLAFSPYRNIYTESLVGLLRAHLNEQELLVHSTVYDSFTRLRNLLLAENAPNLRALVLSGHQNQQVFSLQAVRVVLSLMRLQMEGNSDHALRPVYEASFCALWPSGVDYPVDEAFTLAIQLQHFRERQTVVEAGREYAEFAKWREMSRLVTPSLDKNLFSEASQILGSVGSNFGRWQDLRNTLLVPQVSGISGLADPIQKLTQLFDTALQETECSTMLGSIEILRGYAQQTTHANKPALRDAQRIWQEFANKNGMSKTGHQRVEHSLDGVAAALPCLVHAKDAVIVLENLIRLETARQQAIKSFISAVHQGSGEHEHVCASSEDRAHVPVEKHDVLSCVPDGFRKTVESACNPVAESPTDIARLVYFIQHQNCEIINGLTKAIATAQASDFLSSDTRDRIIGCLEALNREDIQGKGHGDLSMRLVRALLRLDQQPEDAWQEWEISGDVKALAAQVVWCFSGGEYANNPQRKLAYMLGLVVASEHLACFEYDVMGKVWHGQLDRLERRDAKWVLKHATAEETHARAAMKAAERGVAPVDHHCFRQGYQDLAAIQSKFYGVLAEFVNPDNAKSPPCCWYVSMRDRRLRAFL